MALLSCKWQCFLNWLACLYDTYNTCHFCMPMLPCIIHEVLLFVVGVDCACWSVHYCFMRVLIVLVGQLYQDQGVSGVQGWAVGF